MKRMKEEKAGKPSKYYISKSGKKSKKNWWWRFNEEVEWTEKKQKAKDKRKKERTARRIAKDLPPGFTSVTESSSDPLMEGMYDYDDDGKLLKVRSFVPDDHNSITWLPAQSHCELTISKIQVKKCCKMCKLET
jgi:hypothetical protein